MRRKFVGKYGDEGQGLVEYALVLVLVILACVTAVGVFGTGVNALYTRIVGSF